MMIRAPSETEYGAFSVTVEGPDDSSYPSLFDLSLTECPDTETSTTTVTPSYSTSAPSATSSYTTTTGAPEASTTEFQCAFLDITTLSGHGFIVEANNNQQDRAMLGSNGKLTGSRVLNVYILLIHPRPMEGFKLKFTTTGAEVITVDVFGKDYAEIVDSEDVSIFV